MHLDLLVKIHFTSHKNAAEVYPFTYSYQAVFAKLRSLLSDPNKPVFASLL